MQLAAAGGVPATASTQRHGVHRETHRASGLARRPAAVVAVETRSAAARRSGWRASRVHGSPLALTALRAVPGLDVFPVLLFSVLTGFAAIANHQEDADKRLQVRHRACAVLGVKRSGSVRRVARSARFTDSDLFIPKRRPKAGPDLSQVQ